MVILSQIVGTGGFSIVDNLRLIVIAAIFIGIIAVLLYLKFVNSGGKANGKYISKEKAGENIEDIKGSAEGTGGEPVVNSSEAIDEKIKNSETEIITKFEAVIKDLRAQTDTKLTAEIEGLISKTEEREKEFVKKIESVIDMKVQEALNKTECEPAGVSGTNKLQEEKTFVSSDISEEIIENTVDFDMQESLEEGPVGLSSRDKSNVSVDEDVVPTEIKEEELKEPSEDNTNVELDDMVTGGMVGDSADFDIQEFLDELENLPSENDSEAEK